MYRLDALLNKSRAEALDKPLKVSAPHVRLFSVALIMVIILSALLVTGWFILQA